MQRPLKSTRASLLVRRNLRLARSKWGKHLGVALEQALAAWSAELRISIESGDLLLIEGKWYVTHSGLLRLARRKKCCGIHVDMTPEFCDPRSSRWACRATVYKSPTCKGFTGFGDADPSNVDPLVHGAELRMAETRAVNRALRKAYAVPVCSVEEIGSSNRQAESFRESKRVPQPTNGNGYAVSHGPRSSLSNNSSAPARSQSGQGLRCRFHWHEGTARCHAGTSRGLRCSPSRLG